MSGPLVKESDIIDNPSYLLKISDCNVAGIAKTGLIHGGNILYVAELVQHNEATLLKLRWFGKKALLKTVDMLASLGLALDTRIVFTGPESDFRTRLEEAHRKVYSDFNPSVDLLKAEGRKLLGRLNLPTSLTKQIEATPLLNLAVCQMLGAQEICEQEGLDTVALDKILLAARSARSSKGNSIIKKSF